MDVKLKKSTMFSKQKTKKNDPESKDGKNNSISNARFLITVNVLGSTGPIRFLVNKNDSVSDVIDAALKMYALEKRLPPLGSDVNGFLLYPVDAGWDTLRPSDQIGTTGVRNFVLCKKERNPQMTEGSSEILSRKRNGGWKAWINKSFSFKILSH